MGALQIYIDDDDDDDEITIYLNQCQKIKWHHLSNDSNHTFPCTHGDSALLAARRTFMHFTEPKQDCVADCLCLLFSSCRSVLT